MHGKIRYLFYLCIIFSFFVIPGRATNSTYDTLYVTIDVPAISGTNDGSTYSAVFDGSGNAWNQGYGAQWSRDSRCYYTFHMPDYKNDTVSTCQFMLHTSDIVRDSASVGISGLQYRTGTANSSWTSWNPVSDFSYTQNAGHGFVINERTFYPHSGTLYFIASPQSIPNNKFDIQLSYVHSTYYRLGFDSAPVYDGPMQSRVLTITYPIKIPNNDDIMKANTLLSELNQIKSAVSGSSGAVIDYTDLLEDIKALTSSCYLSLFEIEKDVEDSRRYDYSIYNQLSESNYNGYKTLRGVISDIYTIMQSISTIDASIRDYLLIVDQDLNAINGTISRIELKVNNIDSNLQYIADQMREKDSALNDLSGDVSSSDLSNLSDTASTGLDGMEGTVSELTDVVTLNNNSGFVGFLTATVPLVISAKFGAAQMSYKFYLISFLIFASLLAITAYLLKGGPDE